MNDELRAFLVGMDQPQVGAVQAGQLPRKIQPQSVPGNVFADRSAMKTLKNVFARAGWDRSPRVLDAQFDHVTLLAGPDTDFSAREVVLTRILEEILDNHVHVTFFARYVKTRRKVGLQFDVQLVGQRAQVVDPLI